MALEISRQPEKDLTIFIIRGNPAVAEILEGYRELKDRFGLTKHTIWDGREASLTHWQPYDVDILDQLIALIQNGDTRRAGGRSALLVAGQEDAAMLKGLTVMNYRLPQRRKIVFSMEEALAWVCPPSPAGSLPGHPSPPRFSV